MTLPDAMRDWAMAEAAEPPPLAVVRGPRRLVVHRLGRASGGEILLLMTEQESHQSTESLMQSFNLTSREAEVLLWAAKGKTNRDIGDILGISPRTVNKHLDHIYVKLGVETRTAAAAMAMAGSGGPQGGARSPRAE
jgi:DNA-binding CsgD family transcriptional regulator